MLTTKRSRTVVYIFIIVFIFHIALLWLLIKMKHRVPQEDILKTNDDKQMLDKPWVQLQGRPSAPVIFKSLPKPPALAALPPSNLAPSTINQTSLLQKEKDHQEEKEKIETKAEHVVITNDTLPSPLCVTKKEPYAQPQASQQSSSEKPSKFSFSDLAQGFAHHLQEQHAHDDYTMRGKEKGKACAEQIKYAQYGSKICHTIHNAFLTNNNKKVLTIHKNGSLAVRIIINKDGSLHNAHIVQSCESVLIDRKVLEIIRSAAQSFPPLPQFFNMEQCSFVITINNALQVIEHPEQSYWTL